MPLSEDGNTIIYGVAGSGKEDFLATMIYSIITEHDASEASIYVLDFGSETLKVFSDAPQVGDVVTINEEEKVLNLFKMINSAIELRKKSLEKYNGDFKLYNQREEKKLSNYIIVINNYEAFAEAYGQCDEMLTNISRECLKYGIIFVLTCSSSNAVRYKTAQNFKQLIPLQLNDPMDYRSILGKTGGVVPSEITGRGLIKTDGIYEFQTAIITEQEKQFEFIKQTCRDLRNMTNFVANHIPTLPKHVNINLLKQFINENSNGYFPVGIYKNDLKAALYNFKNAFTTTISSLDQDAFPNFINPLIREFAITNKVIVIDTMDAVKPDDSFEYYNTKLEEIIEKINDRTNSLYSKYSSHNYDMTTISNEENIICVITGVGGLVSRLHEESKKNFENMFIKGAEIKKTWFVLVDTTSVLKKLEFENWYKTAVTQNGGIWIGNGINDQSTIKLSKLPAEGKNIIDNNFGFIVNKGQASLAKLLEGEEDGK